MKPTIGRIIARMEVIIDPASSSVETAALPVPPVNREDLARKAAVDPCKRPATPPPAMMATIHFKDEGISVIIDAVAIVPAITETGEAIASMTLSSQGT